MRGRSQVSIAALALLVAVLPACAVHASRGQQTIPANDAQSLSLARKLVLTEEAQDKSVGNFTLLERMVSLPLSTTLASGNPKLKADLAAEVHERLAALKEVYDDALAEAYSKNLTASEMRDIIAFMHGPGGRAEATNLPLLKKELASAQAMEPDALAEMEARSRLAYRQAPQDRRNMIERIFKAQDLEDRTRQGYQDFYSGLNSAASVADSAEGDFEAKGSDATPLFDKSYIEKEVEADVRRTMAIERSFYLTHYSNDELSIVANYLESDAGHGFITTLPKVRHAVASAIYAKFDRIFPSLINSACATANCSSEQRDRLNQEMSLMQRGMNSYMQQ